MADDRGLRQSVRWRGLLVALVGLAAALLIAACGEDSGIESDGDEVEVSTAEAQGEPSGEFTFSNWAFYIDDKTIPEFQKETGLKVNYVEEVNSSDEFFGKVQPQLERGESGGRDLMIATDWLAKRMYDLGYLQKFDKEAIQPALDNLNPDLPAPRYDPDHEYTLPWQSGMFGIVVDTKRAPDITSVNDLFDPKYKGKVVFWNDLREGAALVLKADGADPVDATEEEWLAAIDKVEQAADSGQIRRFAGADYVRDIASGDAVAAISGAGDAIQLTAENPDIEFVMPDQGCVFISDNLVIPVGAPNPTAAYEFINYVYQPENQVQLTEYINYIPPVGGVQEILAEESPELAESQSVFPDEEFTENCSPSVSPAGGPDVVKRIERAWSAVVSK